MPWIAYNLVLVAESTGVYIVNPLFEIHFFTPAYILYVQEVVTHFIK